ncbi:HAD family hydrolase [Candidatus Hodarchaeum mangrovi]
MLIKNGKIHVTSHSLAVFDFDGTLSLKSDSSSWKTVHDYFGTWESHGKAILAKFLKGEISYYEFCRLDAKTWKGYLESDYYKALETIVLRDGLSGLVTFLKEKGFTLAILSMGLFTVVDQIARKYKFDYWIANDIVRINNQITGEVKINIGWKKKGTILQSILKKYNIDKNNCLAIGDASADIEMFEAAGISIAIEPSSEEVAKAADFVCQGKDLREIISFFE